MFKDALYFSSRGLYYLFKRCVVIGRPAITMSDRLPGGRSAVAHILNGRFQQPQMCRHAELYLECKERVWRADPPGTLARVYNICLTFWARCTHTDAHA